MKKLVLIVEFLLIIVLIPFCLKADPPEKRKNTYFLDSRPIGKTPKYLGVNTEVMQYADSANIWDWLSDAGVGMVRVGHPDQTFRKDIKMNESVYAKVKSKEDFDAFRRHITGDPQKNMIWNNYLFSEEIPWLGIPDKIVKKLQSNGIKAIISMAYSPKYYFMPILRDWNSGLFPPDNCINWAAAASAWEYYFACIYRYASKNDVTHFMMLNEPSPDDTLMMQQVGILGKMARMAMEDARKKLLNKQVAADLKLSGPAMYLAWEEYFPYVAPYVDYLDVHLYEPDHEIFGRKLSRALIRARLGNKKLALTEFNRVGGPMPPEESLFSIKPSLQVASLIMEVLSASKPDDPLLEMALFYQFQFPSTHRNFKSLMYGDMNCIDWTGQDIPLKKNNSTPMPDFKQLQLRFATPAFHIFKMLARNTPGTKSKAESYEVLELGEANRGVSAVSDPVNHRNVYPLLEKEKYYALGGGGSELKSLVIKGENRLYINILNPGPVNLKNIGINISALNEKYTSAIVRETSLTRRDMPLSQKNIENSEITIEISPESLTQVIFTKEDLSQISELKIEELTTTPGSLENLKLYETTRLRALGKYRNEWIDLTELNVLWSVTENSGLNIYQGGLLQRIKYSDTAAGIHARTINGIEAQKTIANQKSKK